MLNPIIKLVTALVYLFCLAEGSGCLPRLVAIGDLHGDFENAQRVFEMATVTDSEGNWIGGDYTTVVQTGDVIDRGSDTILLYKWLIDLQQEASDQGGKFIMLLGNHELMNLSENYRYVTDEDVESFGSIEERKLAFSSEGWIGQFLRTLDLTVTVMNTTFVHGGIIESSFDITSLNSLHHELISQNKIELLQTHPLYRSKSESPLWYRGYARSNNTFSCQQLQSSLKTLNSQRMVMGHSITYSRKITSQCQGQAIFIDTAISNVYRKGQLAALEINHLNDLRAIYPDSIEFIEESKSAINNSTKLFHTR